MQEVMCVSAGELVCDPSWTLCAESRCKLTSSITLSYRPSTTAAKTFWSWIPESRRPQHHVRGWTTGDPRLHLHLCPSEVPGRGRYVITADRAEPSSASGLRLRKWGWVRFRVRCESQESCSHAVRSRTTSTWWGLQPDPIIVVSTETLTLRQHFDIL